LPLTAERARALVNAIAAAPSVVALNTLRRQLAREGVPATAGGFVALLIEFRRVALERSNRPTPAVAATDE